MMPDTKVKQLADATSLNREGWLTEVARSSEVLFKGFRLNPYRVTCGWPCREAMGRRRRVGECHAARISKGNIHEIFISPLLDDPADVAGTLVHEMAHVAAGIEAGHKGQFIAVCKAVGLTKGRPTSAAPGTFLADWLQRVTEPIGTYPHQALVPTAVERPKRPSSSVRLVCVCGCKVIISAKWLIEAGPPVCGCGLPFVPADKED